MPASSEADCWSRLERASHGVLATVHPGRGVDAVPVVFVMVDGVLVLPVDTVKDKRSTRLQRLANIKRDPRCVLVVDQYDDDWARLWWVRVHGLGAELPVTSAHLDALSARFPAYGEDGAVVSVVAITPSAVTGWQAT